MQRSEKTKTICNDYISLIEHDISWEQFQKIFFVDESEEQKRIQCQNGKNASIKLKRDYFDSDFSIEFKI